MGRSVEKSGKNVNDAIAAALEELNLTIDDVHVDILNEGKTGLFGLLSGKPARVRVSELEENERMPQPGYSKAAKEKSDDSSFDGDVEEVDESGDFDTEANNIEQNNAIYNGDAAGQYSVTDKTGAASAGMDEDIHSSSRDIDYESELNRALDYLSEIFNGINVSVSMSSEPAEEGILINIESDDSGILIGHRGETLDAIQYLVNLYMNKGRNAFIRVSVDVENYKKKREAALIRLASQMADKVVRLRRNFTMDAMNSYERRIIHSVLQSHPRVETYSVGEEPNRKVVVTLKNRGGYSPR